MSARRIDLTLGPVFFHWPPERLADFYARIADEAPVDRVYLGEVVCGKRAPLIDHALQIAAERLARGGKQVVWSTLALPATRRDQVATSDLSSTDADLLEINDFSALFSRRGAPFVAGPFLNVYNEASAQELMARGCERLCPPVELALSDIGAIHRGAPGLELELFAFGRAPLALSGRCYHARAAGLTRDSCRYVCEADPDGMAVRTLDGADFLAVNGVQTLSHGLHVAAVAPQVLTELGVVALRLSPHTADMVAVAAIFRDMADARLEPAAAVNALTALGLPGVLVKGYLCGGPGAAPAVPAEQVRAANR